MDVQEKAIKELKQVVEHANDGDWIPLAIVAFLIGVIIYLLFYIVRSEQKRMNARHTRSEELIERLTQVSTENQKIIGIHEAEIKNLKATA